VAIFFIVCFLLCYHYAGFIYAFLATPLINANINTQFIYTNLSEAFLTELKVALYSALFLTTPLFSFQLYRFIAVGLFKQERYLAIFYLLAAHLLFFFGICIVYFYLMPIAWSFFINYQFTSFDTLNLVLNPKISEYLDLTLQLMLAFGIAFQLPIIIIFLCQVGLIHVDSLKKYRRQAIVVIFALAAVLTPPDIISQVVLAVPLLLLYEISILICNKFQNNIQ
jgi:sec-independent protein translocase protein TatC